MTFTLAISDMSKNDLKRGFVFPREPSEKLAEFMGILTGDGYLNYYPYQYKYIIEITGDSRFDRSYLCDYVNRLVKDLFNLDCKYSFKKGQNTLNLRLISKGLLNYLVKIGFVKGKKGQIGIPLWIIENKIFMRGFLRGIIDTDGSIHFRREYPIISIASKSRVLIKSISGFLTKSGFKLKSYYQEKRIEKRGYENSEIYRVTLNGHANFALWLNQIGFSNERHLRKIEKNGDGGI